MSISAKHDWMTAEGAVAALQSQLEVEDYGSAFQGYRGSTLLDERTVRQVFIDAISKPETMARYQDAIQRMVDGGDDINSWQAAVRATPEGLEFEHGDFTAPIDIIDSGLRIARPGGNATKRQKAVERKREKIRDTGEDDYLTHAAQCGYLLRNVRLGFLRSPRMQGTSVKMRINNLTLDQLQRFIDATGSTTLAALSTHEGTQPGSDDSGRYIYSGWIGFALDVIDFLNLELVIDVEGLKAQHRDVGGDTGGRTLDAWDTDAETVIGQLADRRPDIDTEMIRTYFMEGHSGELFVEGDTTTELPKVAAVL